MRKKKLMKIASVLLLCVLFLQGCSLIGKFSEQQKRNEMEEKLADIEKVYPTEKVSDLFEIFPNGFEIRQGYSEVREEGQYFYNIYLDGDSKTKKLTGTYKKDLYRDEYSKEEIFKIPISYDEEKGLIDENGEKIDYPYPFLFQVYTLNREKLSKLEHYNLFKHPLTTGFSIGYHNIRDPILSSYFHILEKTKLEMTLGGPIKNVKTGNLSISIHLGNMKDEAQKIWFNEKVNAKEREK